MKTVFSFLIIVMIFSCGEVNRNSDDNIELILDAGRQDSIFRSLQVITNNTLPESIWQDSLAFLLLPVQASCPSCRKKTIDSIVKHKDQLLPKRFIILSANGGKKTMNSYFKEEHSTLPTIEDRLFLDSTNEAYKLDLCSDKPTFYYTYNRKAYKKISAIPATVRDDLREFFLGKRKGNN